VFFLYQMAIKKLKIDAFLELLPTGLLLDVRSPAEYAHAHIPEAYPLPLFNNEQRAVVGTAYKQESREQAIKIGLDYFGPNMRSMVEEVEKLLMDAPKKVLVYCWRGGMRSGGVAWLLDLYGFDVYQLEGGYKAYRNWVLDRFQADYTFKIIGGYTGSAKTYILNNLEKTKAQTIDLEGLGHHKGSALGGIGQPPQPSQEMFENRLAMSFASKNENNLIFLEDESQRIGNLNIPKPIWEKMVTSQVLFLEVPFEERLNFLDKEYGILPKNELSDAITRIQKRLGGLESKNALNFLEENNIKECFRILLTYYDRWYKKGVENKKDVVKIKTQSGDIATNTKLIQDQLL
jgi:tRNA 2-selenouridine synthase